MLFLTHQKAMLGSGTLSVSWSLSIRYITANFLLQVTLSRNGKVLLTCCDDGTIWRWDRTNNGAL